MKRTLFLGVVIGALLSSSLAFSATRSATVELSISPSFESVKADDGDAQNTLMLPIRIGVFATPTFEIEGDLNITSLETATGMWVFINGVYNFDTGEGKARPFLLAGVGLGNAVRLLGLALETDEPVLGFDVGAGVKAPITDRIYFRAEYRYDRVSYDRTTYPFDSNNDDKVTIQGHRLLMGFSVFFGTDPE
jgi:opacity protein-like surface antigen